MADDTLPAKLARLQMLLHDLPHSIPEGSTFYGSSDLKVGPVERQQSDGTELGALHKRLEIVFGPYTSPDPIHFLERGESLENVVNVFQDALARNLSGDKTILHGWVDRLSTSALAAYAAANKKPPAERRQSQPSKRAMHMDIDDGAQDQPVPAKRKGTVTEFLQPQATKKAKAVSGAKKAATSGELTPATARSAPAAPKAAPAASKTVPKTAAQKAGKRDTSTKALLANPPDETEHHDDSDADYAPPRKPLPSDEEMSDDDELMFDDQTDKRVDAGNGKSKSNAIDVDDVSDGESALKAVNAAEEAATAKGM